MAPIAVNEDTISTLGESAMSYDVDEMVVPKT